VHSSDENYAEMDRLADELEAAEAAGRQIDPDDAFIAAGVEGTETVETAEGTTIVAPRIQQDPDAEVDGAFAEGEGLRRRRPSLSRGVARNVPRGPPVPDPYCCGEYMQLSKGKCARQ
jgi:hypothetical protein